MRINVGEDQHTNTAVLFVFFNSEKYKRRIKKKLVTFFDCLFHRFDFIKLLSRYLTFYSKNLQYLTSQIDVFLSCPRKVNFIKHYRQSDSHRKN